MPESMQSKVNKDPKLADAYVSKMIEDGWVLSSFDKVQESDQIRYIRKMKDGTEKFISGGIVIKKEEGYLIFKGGMRNWSLQAEDIVTIWMRELKEKKKKKGDNLIKLKNRLGLKHRVEHNGQVIYSSNNLRDVVNFKNTGKYQRIKEGVGYVFVD